MKDDADPILGSEWCLIQNFNELKDKALHNLKVQIHSQNQM